jgi:hypothetical protein
VITHEAAVEPIRYPPQRIPLLARDEADDVLARIDEHRESWTLIGPRERSRTFALGTPSHLGMSFDDYSARVDVTNPILKGRFGDLFDRIADAIAPVLSTIHIGPIIYEDRLSRPGFRIAEIDATGMSWFGRAHWDWNFAGLPWEPVLPTRLELTDTLSFTLPIAVPSAGAAFVAWADVTSANVVRHAASHRVDMSAACEALIADRVPERYDYRVGELFMHTGQVVHAPAPSEAVAGERRVTLQGQALFHHGSWRVFW